MGVAEDKSSSSSGATCGEGDTVRGSPEILESRRVQEAEASLGRFREQRRGASTSGAGSETA